MSATETPGTPENSDVTPPPSHAAPPTDAAATAVPVEMVEPTAPASVAPTTATTKAGHARLYGLLVVIAGVILLVAGVVVYAVVSSTLADQKITVSDDAAHFAGQTVSQPWQAYAQANVIGKHATEIAGGKTYAELPRDDPNRDTVMTASFLQASLFTSVVAFGVAAMAVGLGICLILIGLAIRSLARPRPVTVMAV